ncbi:biotin--[acetyl-CoA-carboxylase] ligase [Caldovatus aquaticus]|uniref:Biotin--[acetyl-CoA-carboxylase] ligase n=1 Tax=Caldovatus aquaticus TaxID=2865671 RepID=A0ABS7EYP6_9PROT|nr:biotin--[acetyl-CoA-carboxylase] ligase [Caldovatus aquaticus]
MTARPPPRSAAPVWRLRVHEELPSTQDAVLRAAEAGEPEGLAVLARRQTAGRGREGRGWESPPGNLHLSVLLRPGGPVRHATRWALLAAVALIEVLAPHLPPGAPPLRLKWPNDVLAGEEGAKLAGILAEAATRPGGGAAWLALGIGANLAYAPVLPDGRPTSSLAALGAAPPPAPEACAAALLSALDRWRRILAHQGFAPVREAWLARGPRLGTPLAVGGAAGAFAGLGEDGSLLLAGPDGGIRAVRTGEVEAV